MINVQRLPELIKMTMELAEKDAAQIARLRAEQKKL